MGAGVITGLHPWALVRGPNLPIQFQPYRFQRVLCYCCGDHLNTSFAAQAFPISQTNILCQYIDNKQPNHLIPCGMTLVYARTSVIWREEGLRTQKSLLYLLEKMEFPLLDIK